MSITDPQNSYDGDVIADQAATITRLRAEVEKREQRDLERAEKYLKEHAELRAEIELLTKERDEQVAANIAWVSRIETAESALTALRMLCAKMKAPELLAIGERLRTQDNRITQNPMFCVQEKYKIRGLDQRWTDRTEWILDGETVEPETEGAEEYGYREEWQTVMVAFTEEGCKEYLRQNSHNLRVPRIYVESFNRCPEMIAIRQALALTAEALAGKVLCDGKEVEELRRDRERLDWLGNYYWDKFVVRFTSCADEKQLRAAIDAAMKP